MLLNKTLCLNLLCRTHRTFLGSRVSQLVLKWFWKCKKGVQPSCHFFTVSELVEENVIEVNTVWFGTNSLPLQKIFLIFFIVVWKQSLYFSYILRWLNTLIRHSPVLWQIEEYCFPTDLLLQQLFLSLLKFLVYYSFSYITTKNHWGTVAEKGCHTRLSLISVGS